ncbi:uncharacterized protein ovol1b isoform X3 [Scleropages formosus]|uniref:uncharacterized protein ovol1b isoform X3 n=1 Tax=Scleropages formosus TaxID=113540 RepID=UPI00087852BF|nr:uncharacterized protein LOC108920274 isoform X3 [Scleropages formosus]
MPRAFMVKKVSVSPGKRTWSQALEREIGTTYTPGVPLSGVQTAASPAESSPRCPTWLEHIKCSGHVPVAELPSCSALAEEGPDPGGQADDVCANFFRPKIKLPSRRPRCHQMCPQGHRCSHARCARRCSACSVCSSAIRSVTARPRSTCATTVGRASTTPSTSRGTFAHTQVCGPTSAAIARGASPSAARSSPTCARSTASRSPTATRSAAASCTCARSAASPPWCGTLCGATCWPLTPTARLLLSRPEEGIPPGRREGRRCP